ncbi:MAG: CHAT domain-containing protein [Sphingobacteriia bacterium]|nr:CHAT domain-containing protein [Sphingobacteriia bacterium]
MRIFLLISFILLFDGYLSGIPEIQGIDLLQRKADYFYQQLAYDSASIYYAQAIYKYGKSVSPEVFGYLLNQHASSLFWQDRLDECEKACRISLKFCIEKLGPHHSLTAQAHINIGMFKFIAGNSGVIGEHFTEAAFIFEEKYGKYHPKVAKAYEWLGEFHESRSDTALARKFLWKSLDIYNQTIGADHPDVAELYRYIGLFYKRFAKPDSALIYFEKSKRLFDNKYGEANFQSVKCLNNIADVYGKHFNQWNKVEHIFRQCLRLIKGFNCPNRYTHAMTLYQMVDYNNENQDYHQAIDYLNQILQLYYPDFKNQDVFDNPEVNNSNLVTIPKLIFIYKANILIKLSAIDTLNRQSLRKNASDCYVLLDRFIDEIRSNLVGFDAWLHFANSHAKLYYMMALHELHLFELTQNESFLNKGLYYIEKKKLSENLNKFSDSFCFADDSNFATFSQIEELKENINTLKAQRLLSAEKEIVDRQIIHKTLSLDALYADIKSTQPIAGIDDEIFDIQIKEIQHRLSPDECLLYYADNTQDYKQIPYSLIIIAINKKQVKFTEIKGQETFLLASDYYNLMATNQATDSIHAIGGKLFNLLISPVGNMLKQKIIIQPSSFLSPLSFESLPDLKQKNQSSFLIENHLIWKIFSLNDLFAKPSKQLHRFSDSLLAVAPTFNETKVGEIALLAQRDASLINLAGAVKECNLISNYFGTLLLSGLNVSKSRFKQISNRFSYIHISTHGVPQGDDHEMVQLAFNPAGDFDNGWLSFYEILNLDLNADLIVLSACKTGVGKRNNGEGSLNLAWAFRQAGAKSAIISLWDVSDYASSQIMPTFYENLSKGYSKPDALRKAKLKFIKNHDQMAASPFFWAAFDFIGSHENAIFHAGRSNLAIVWIAIISGVSFALVLLLLLKKQKGKSRIISTA